MGEGESVETFGEKERGLVRGLAMAKERELRDCVNEIEKPDI